MMINCSDKHKTKKLKVYLLKVFFHVVVFAKFPSCEASNLCLVHSRRRKETLTEIPLVLNTKATGDNQLDDSEHSFQYEIFRRMGKR